jgi:hypothetical protein
MLPHKFNALHQRLHRNTVKHQPSRLFELWRNRLQNLRQTAATAANQYGISIAEYAKRLSSSGGALLGKAGDDTPYFVVANKTMSGIENRAILPVKDLKNVQKDMQKILVSELKGGKNPFLCHDRKAKESDIVVPKPTGAMMGWIGEPIAPQK